MKDWTWDLSVLYRDFQDPAIEKDFQKMQGFYIQVILKKPIFKPIIELSTLTSMVY